MRVDNWDTKLSNYIVEQSKTKLTESALPYLNFLADEFTM